MPELILMSAFVLVIGRAVLLTILERKEPTKQ